MSRIVDDEPPIKTHPASQAYRDGWERMFGIANRVFDPALLKTGPNPSPVSGSGTVIDTETGAELDYTCHEDGSFTITAERPAVR